MTEVQETIYYVCAEMSDFLIEKNRRYGNSALEPCRIFSKADSLEQLRVRIDDKLNRIKTGTVDNEDSVKDLTGYLILYMVAQRLAPR